MKGRRVIHLLAGGAAIVTAVFALRFAFQPVFSLTPFVSPPVTIRGERVELLIPAGWLSDSANRFSGSLPRFVIEPEHESSIVTKLLQKFRLVSNERTAIIWLTVRRRSFPSSDSMRQVFETRINRETIYVADATMPVDQDHEVCLQYLRSNEAAFRNTADQILESIRITR